MITTIFFDWGGVLADDPGDDFLSKLLTNIGANEDQIREIHETYMKDFMKGALSEADYWAVLKNKYSLAVRDSISSEFLQWKGLVVNNDVLQLVEAARANNIKTALLSNVIEPTYTVLKEAGHYDTFDFVVASCKVGYAKPQQEIYDLSLEMAGATAAQSLFIDDKETNLIPARAMGFSTILAQNPSQIIADVRSYLG